MQLLIEVVVARAHAAQPTLCAAAVRRIMDVAALRDVDVDSALREGVLRGVISSDRVMDLAMLDVVADFELTVG